MMKINEGEHEELCNTTSCKFMELKDALINLASAVYESRLLVFWLGVIVGMLITWIIDDSGVM